MSLTQHLTPPVGVSYDASACNEPTFPCSLLSVRGGVAQLAERGSHKPYVGGSNPPAATNHKLFFSLRFSPPARVTLVRGNPSTKPTAPTPARVVDNTP